MNIESFETVLASDRLTETKLADGTGVLLDLEGQQVLTLNATGIYLVDQLRSGARSTRALVEGLMAEFDVEAGAAEADVNDFILNLAQFLKIVV